MTATITHLSAHYCRKQRERTTGALVIELLLAETLCAELQRAFEADPAFCRRVKESM